MARNQPIHPFLKAIGEEIAALGHLYLEAEKRLKEHALETAIKAIVGELPVRDAFQEAERTHQETKKEFTRSRLGYISLPPDMEIFDLHPPTRPWVRATNRLRYNRILTVYQVLERSDSELLEFREFGRRSLNLLKEALLSNGYLKLPEGIDPNIPDSGHRVELDTTE